MARHGPATVVLDLTVSLAIGGGCLAGIAQLRAEPGVFGLVASDPTVSRVIDPLAADAPAVLTVIGRVRRQVRQWVWDQAPDHQIEADRPLIVDLDGS